MTMEDAVHVTTHPQPHLLKTPVAKSHPSAGIGADPHHRRKHVLQVTLQHTTRSQIYHERHDNDVNALRQYIIEIICFTDCIRLEQRTASGPYCNLDRLKSCEASSTLISSCLFLHNPAPPPVP